MLLNKGLDFWVCWGAQDWYDSYVCLLPSGNLWS
ncbi:hypothetical protein T4D_7615 [Trichinella pseudospiralis]|uniref:Uncharacterized protein n=1 Tax=Trichinella pseudospiralis TaxID=6337 RepID=A0A0V1DLR6_TRIPS|nr:hypothetical protein T4D_7615 [Trichinella pseudospiralis]